MKVALQPLGRGEKAALAKQTSSYHFDRHRLIPLDYPVKVVSRSYS